MTKLRFHIAILLGALLPVFVSAQKPRPRPKPAPKPAVVRSGVGKIVTPAVEPKALPQEPGDGRLGTDAGDDGLKGKVKSVLDSIEYLGGSGMEARPLQKNREKFYDPKGNLLKHITYDHKSEWGLVEVYGFIDKMRVSNSKTYGLFWFVGGDPDPVDGADPRYETKYEFKYDEKGRITEWASFNSAGKPESKQTYSYDGNTRVTSVLDLEAGGQVSTKRVDILDERGNPTESAISQPGIKSTPFTNHYTYITFDAAGNWTKRSVDAKDPGPNSKTFNRSIEYRTIAYYK